MMTIRDGFRIKKIIHEFKVSALNVNGESSLSTGVFSTPEPSILRFSIISNFDNSYTSSRTTGTDINYNVTGITNGITYYFQVVAINQVDQSSANQIHIIQKNKNRKQ